MKIYFQNLVCCMMFFEKDFKIKVHVRLICKCFLKIIQTNESYLYFEGPPSFSKNIMVKIWRNRFISILELTSWHASTITNLYVYTNQKL
jgi:hypothetical protein